MRPAKEIQTIHTAAYAPAPPINYFFCHFEMTAGSVANFFNPKQVYTEHLREDQ